MKGIGKMMNLTVRVEFITCSLFLFIKTLTIKIFQSLVIDGYTMTVNSKVIQNMEKVI